MTDELLNQILSAISYFSFWALNILTFIAIFVIAVCIKILFGNKGGK